MSVLRMIEPKYIEAIKRFEGFTPRARWDYAQFSNGFGTRARYAGETVDEAEALRRLNVELSSAARTVDALRLNLEGGLRAALISLTFNAGPAWTKAGLGKAVVRGDWQEVRERFLQYNKAGGVELPGLAARRSAEAEWMLQGLGNRPDGQASARGDFVAEPSRPTTASVASLQSVKNTAFNHEDPTAFVDRPERRSEFWHLAVLESLRYGLTRPRPTDER